MQFFWKDHFSRTFGNMQEKSYFHAFLFFFVFVFVFQERPSFIFHLKNQILILGQKSSLLIIQKRPFFEDDHLFRIFRKRKIWFFVQSVWGLIDGCNVVDSDLKIILPLHKYTRTHTHTHTHTHKHTHKHTLMAPWKKHNCC